MFEKEELNDIVLVQSIIILNYDSLSDSIAEFDLDIIIIAIKVVSLKVKNIKNDVLCIERIMLMFTDELEMPEKLKNKIRDRKKSKKESTGGNITKKEEAKKVQHDEEPKTQDEKIKDGDEKNHKVIFVEDIDVRQKKKALVQIFKKKKTAKKCNMMKNQKFKMKRLKMEMQRIVI